MMFFFLSSITKYKQKMGDFVTLALTPPGETQKHYPIRVVPFEPNDPAVHADSVERKYLTTLISIPKVSSRSCGGLAVSMYLGVIVTCDVDTKSLTVWTFNDHCCEEDWKIRRMYTIFNVDDDRVERYEYYGYGHDHICIKLPFAFRLGEIGNFVFMDNDDDDKKGTNDFQYLLVPDVGNGGVHMLPIFDTAYGASRYYSNKRLAPKYVAPPGSMDMPRFVATSAPAAKVAVSVWPGGWLHHNPMRPPLSHAVHIFYRTTSSHAGHDFQIYNIIGLGHLLSTPCNLWFDSDPNYVTVRAASNLQVKCNIHDNDHVRAILLPRPRRVGNLEYFKNSGFNTIIPLEGGVDDVILIVEIQDDNIFKFGQSNVLNRRTVFRFAPENGGCLWNFSLHKPTAAVAVPGVGLFVRDSIPASDAGCLQIWVPNKAALFQHCPFPMTRQRFAWMKAISRRMQLLYMSR